MDRNDQKDTTISKQSYVIGSSCSGNISFLESQNEAFWNHKIIGPLLIHKLQVKVIRRMKEYIYKNNY